MTEHQRSAQFNAGAPGRTGGCDRLKLRAVNLSMTLFFSHPSDEKITVTKLDAAKRQLRTAITLWFTDGDPVSVHTLIAAAHEITHSLFRMRGFSGLLYDNKLIREEYRGDLAKRLKQFSTFFKHAQKDPDAEIMFDPTLNELLLIFVTVGIQSIEPLVGPVETSFLLWVALHRPDVYPLGIEIEKRVSAGTLKSLRKMGRREYFQAYHANLGSSLR